MVKNNVFGESIQYEQYAKPKIWYVGKTQKKKLFEVGQLQVAVGAIMYRVKYIKHI